MLSRRISSTILNRATTPRSCRAACVNRSSSINSLLLLAPFASTAARTAAAAASSSATSPIGQVADISPLTAFEKEQARSALEEKRVDRFITDMYQRPVFSPVVLLLTTIGLGGFCLTWFYNVAHAVYSASLGEADDEEGGKDGSELG